MLDFGAAKRKEAAETLGLCTVCCVCACARACVLALPGVLTKLREKQAGFCSYKARTRGKEVSPGASGL